MECVNNVVLSALVRDHAANPRNHGPIRKFNGLCRITGPCGDTMEFWVVASNGKVEKAAFITDGCGTSLACGSMATVLAEGKRIEDVTAIGQQEILDALGGLPPESQHCALLAANTLKGACEDYMKREKDKTKDSGTGQGSCDTCADSDCSASKRKMGESNEEFVDRQKLQSRLCRISNKIVVLSGKGGVGKSTVAVNLATAMMLAGKRVGLLDVDIHGPSIPTMLGLEHEVIRGDDEGMIPVDFAGMKVMSLGFMLENQDHAVIWRGPMKMGVIKQFLKDVVWGDLDYLIIDSPPGTGDELLSICQLIGKLEGAVVVTTPQKVAAVDVRKSISFCRQLEVPVLGVVENMSGFACPKCGEITQILSSGGGKQIAEDMNVPFLGSIPMDPKITEACDTGRAFVRYYAKTPTAEIMHNIINIIIGMDKAGAAIEPAKTMTNIDDKYMKFAIPLVNGRLCMHFGHCEYFALIDVDLADKKILKREDVAPPPHEPGLLPPWLAERGANAVIAGGMGQSAQRLFAQQGIHVVVGASSETPEVLISDYLAGTLQTGENACDH